MKRKLYSITLADTPAPAIPVGWQLLMLRVAICWITKEQASRFSRFRKKQGSNNLTWPAEIASLSRLTNDDRREPTPKMVSF